MELQSTIFKRLMLLLDTELQMPVHEGLQFSTTFILQEHTNIAFHALGTSKLVIWLLITHDYVSHLTFAVELWVSYLNHQNDK